MKKEYVPVRVETKMKLGLTKLSKASKRELSDYIRLLFQYAIDNNLKF
jgi:hypothetical protein